MTNKSTNLVQIDRENLIRLLEAFVDTSEGLQRELMLYQTLFSASCTAKGLNDQQIQATIDTGRKAMSEKISESCRANYQNLLSKLPRLVELLSSDQDAALRFLKEWKPTGFPN